MGRLEKTGVVTLESIPSLLLRRLEWIKSWNLVFLKIWVPFASWNVMLLEIEGRVT